MDGFFIDVPLQCEEISEALANWKIVIFNRLSSSHL